MKASELNTKSEELKRFETYNEQIKRYVEELEKVQYIIKNGIKSGKTMKCEFTLTVYGIGQYDYTSKGDADMLHNKLTASCGTSVSLYILKGYEEKIIENIMNLARIYKIEEDRFKPIFEECEGISKYMCEGEWFK